MFSLFDRQKILYVLNSVIVGGGVELTTLEEARCLRARGYQVTVCALREMGEAAARFTAEGIAVHHCPVYKTAAGERLRWSLAGWLRLVRFMLRGRFGTIVCGQSPSHYFARLACFPRLGRRLFAIERTRLWERKRIYRRLDRLCSWWTDRIVCVSRDVRDALVSRSGVNPRRVTVIEHGYPAPAPGPALPRDARLAGSFVYGCVSRLVPTKRVDILLRAFTQVRTAHPETRLLLVGGGELDGALRALAAELGIAEHVLFLGEVPDAHPYYPWMDAFVFPSISEGLGGVYVEAWLHGLPVICAAVRPMSDYVEHGENGLTFVPDDPASLADAMIRLRLDDGLRRRLGQRGAATAATVFNFETNLGRLCRLLTEGEGEP